MPTVNMFQNVENPITVLLKSHQCPTIAETSQWSLWHHNRCLWWCHIQMQRNAIFKVMPCQILLYVLDNYVASIWLNFIKIGFLVSYNRCVLNHLYICIPPYMDKVMTIAFFKYICLVSKLWGSGNWIIRWYNIGVTSSQSQYRKQ